MTTPTSAPEDQWLPLQRKLYQDLPDQRPAVALHPVSGTWQPNTPYLQSQFWWGGGASQEAFSQLPAQIPTDQFLAVLTFGPVQTFLGAGQRLRDWAVASWLCHYLAAVTIYHWEQQGGFVILPLHRSSPLINWLNSGVCPDPSDRFWQAELPNVFTGIVPATDSTTAEAWLQNLQATLLEEWSRLVQAIENTVVQREREKDKAHLDGLGWRVIHRDHQHLWSVYYNYAPIEPDRLTAISDQLHQNLEGQKLGRTWAGTWWGGRTSPTAGSLSIWHPGLRPVHQGGTWGIPDDQLDQWWDNIPQHHAGLFSPEERLNSLELIKRLASVPQYIQPALQQLWGYDPPPCPWERFPDRTAVAAAWVPACLDATTWNHHLSTPSQDFQRNDYKTWGIPRIDEQAQYIHPEILERRNLKAWNPGSDANELKELQEYWDISIPRAWTTPIQWTVGWRGDGDNMGKWLSGQQYQAQKLAWENWHPSADQVNAYNLQIPPPTVPQGPRKLELPHMLDLSVLFGHWNQLLYQLVEQEHSGKVIFAGGDDFLLLGALPDAVPLTSQLHHLWSGHASPLTAPLDPPTVGWVDYNGTPYPVPGTAMTFSLGVVIAQRRIPQSLWHRNLNEAYKAAKTAGRDCVCVRVLFNSGQSLEWICPWPLWHLLMDLQLVDPQPKTTPTKSDSPAKTALNLWEKLLGYIQSTRLKQPNLSTAGTALVCLWQSVGLSLTWQQVLDSLRHSPSLRNTILKDWEWWIAWVSLRGFLARQDRDRQQWLEDFSRSNR